MTHHNSAGRVLCILSAGALLLAGVPFARASDSSLSALEEFAWPSEDEALFLTHQASAERGKRTGLSGDMRGSLGSSGGGGGGPSLSIVNPLDVLRQRLLLEMVRRRMRQSEDQILANREMLNTVGKRSAPAPGTDLRGLLLRRHVRSARGDGDGVTTSPRLQTSSGGAHVEQTAATHAQHSRVGTTL